MKDFFQLPVGTLKASASIEATGFDNNDGGQIVEYVFDEVPFNEDSIGRALTSDYDADDFYRTLGSSVVIHFDPTDKSLFVTADKTQEYAPAIVSIIYFADDEGILWYMGSDSQPQNIITSVNGISQLPASVELQKSVQNAVSIGLIPSAEMPTDFASACKYPIEWSVDEDTHQLFITPSAAFSIGDKFRVWHRDQHIMTAVIALPTMKIPAGSDVSPYLSLGSFNLAQFFSDAVGTVRAEVDIDSKYFDTQTASVKSVAIHNVNFNKQQDADVFDAFTEEYPYASLIFGEYIHLDYRESDNSIRLRADKQLDYDAIASVTYFADDEGIVWKDDLGAVSTVVAVNGDEQLPVEVPVSAGEVNEVNVQFADGSNLPTFSHWSSGAKFGVAFSATLSGGYKLGIKPNAAYANGDKFRVWLDGTHVITCVVHSQPEVVGIDSDRQLPVYKTIYIGDRAVFLCVFDDPDYVSSASDYSCDVQGINLSMEPEGENLLSVAIDDDVEPNTEFTICCYGKPIITGNTAQRLPEPDWSTFRGAAESADAADSVAATNWGVHKITNAVTPGKEMWVRIEGENLDRIDADLFDVTSESGIKPEYIRTDIASESIAYVYFKFNDAATGDFAMNYNGNVIFMFSFDMQTKWVQKKSVMVHDNEPATVTLKANGVIPETGFDKLESIQIILTDPDGVGYDFGGSRYEIEDGLFAADLSFSRGDFDVIRGNRLTYKLSEDKSEFIVNIPNGCYADNEGLYSIEVILLDYNSPSTGYSFNGRLDPIPKFLIPKNSELSENFPVYAWNFPVPNANMIVTARLTNSRGVDRIVQFTWANNKLRWNDGTMNDGASIDAVTFDIIAYIGVKFVDTYPNDYVFQILKIENDGQTLYSIED